MREGSHLWNEWDCVHGGFHSLNEIYSSSSIAHVMFFPIFIHCILLHLGLEDFPASELVHMVAPVVATFLRQRVAQMGASFKCPRVETSGVAPPPPSFTGDTTTEESVDPTVAAATTLPPPSTLDDSNIRRMLETVMTIQVAYGQILVDMLDEFRSLRVDFEHLRRSPLSPPFDDGL